MVVALPRAIVALLGAASALSVIFKCIDNTFRVAKVLPVRLCHFMCSSVSFCATAALPSAALALYGATAALSVEQQHFPCDSGTMSVTAALPVWR